MIQPFSFFQMSLLNAPPCHPTGAALEPRPQVVAEPAALYATPVPFEFVGDFMQQMFHYQNNLLGNLKFIQSTSVRFALLALAMYCAKTSLRSSCQPASRNLLP